MTTQRGFTLIEMAIVLIIVTFLIGGLVMPLAAQIQGRRIAETKKTLEEAREAIIGYAMSHNVNISPPTTCTCAYKTNPSAPLDPPTLNAPDDPLDTSDDPDSTCPISLCPATSTTTLTLPITRHYLPCPDLNDTDPDPSVDNDDDGDLTNDVNNGREDRYKTGTNIDRCSASTGNLPWVTLGTAPQDSWGNRLRYSVTDCIDSAGSTCPVDNLTGDRTANYGDSSQGFFSASVGDNQICTTSTGGCPTGTVALNVPAVVLSYGPNGWGARNFNGTKLSDPTSADELENTDADTSFVSRSPGKAGDASGEFDDLVVWISDGVLRSRVCPAGGCP
jgi:prepilin-type N-terminal cleavage/methylation domain-containing protein